MPPDFLREQELYEISPGGIIAGVDEAGRGPWAGPVIAAAVILDPRGIPPGLDDSKKLSALKREALYAQLQTCARIGVGQASVAEIDTQNILNASLLAMTRAVSALPATPSLVLVDGNRAPILACKSETLIGGDARSLSIAAASIIAKVSRDRIMGVLDTEFPGYGWKTNQGYGTRAHRDALSRLGVTPHHRRSFKPVYKMLCEDSPITH
ncbi:MAG: ribonuclease HII [Alphaproteobacteria bacterium]|nr:ribonuclease HII [Alphaproteobacteria bacterium]